jgi:predicted MFS family arabinose efflux permease
VASLVPEVYLLGTWMGMSLFMGGIGILIGSPICGVIADSSSGFSGALIFAASFTVAGGMLFILTYILRSRR